MQCFHRQQTVSPAEITFGKWFKKETTIQLMPADDWMNPRTGTIYEIKDISYPSTHFNDKIRLNMVSMERHATMGRKVVIVLCFSDGVRMQALVQDVIQNATKDVQNTFGDRPTFFVPIAIFKPLKAGMEIA